MNHFQPQPAGLPSGSFGGRRGARTAAPWLRRLLPAPIHARLLTVPMGAMAGGGLLALAAIASGRPGAHLAAALGLALAAVGLGLLAGLIGLAWLEHRHHAGGAMQAPLAAAALLLAVATWGCAVALALGQWSVLLAALSRALPSL